MTLPISRQTPGGPAAPAVQTAGGSDRSYVAVAGTGFLTTPGTGPRFVRCGRPNRRSPPTTSVGAPSWGDAMGSTMTALSAAEAGFATLLARPAPLLFD